MQRYPPVHEIASVCIAAPDDILLLTQWEMHLQPLQQAGFISVWSELHLGPGEDRTSTLHHQIEKADSIFLLVSASFFSSPECLTLMNAALLRSQTSTARVIPLLIRSVAWQESPLRSLSPYPVGGKPIMLWSNQDEGWNACVQEVRRFLGRRISEADSPGSSPSHTDPDWERMLRLLRRSYKELLDQSLHGIAWVELGLATHPEMVSNITNLLFRLPQGGERLLAPGTSILDAFDEAEGELLILGAPGAGKSTLLLDLVQQLVNRALADPIYPLPVIFRLSSWALGRPALADWMAEQLSDDTYGIPRLLSEGWVTQGRLLPLLDGLDEMEEAARPACIAAINTYRQTHLAPLVVCSRQTEYEAAATRYRLTLQSAIIVQPLSDEQIEEYLGVAGPSFAGVRTALQQEQALRELATTPLMLSVLLLTYRGATAESIIHQGMEREQQVWTDYVARQVAEKGHDTRYPLEQTRHWLTYLAQQMRLHQQTIFSAEYLQPDWLAHNQQRTVKWLATRLPSILLGGCVSLLVLPIVGETNDLVYMLQMGLLGGFVGKSLSQQVAVGPVRVSSHLFAKKQAHFRNALLLSMLIAVSCVLFRYLEGYALSGWVRDSCILGLGSGLSFWLFQGLISRIPSQRRRKVRVHSSWQKNLTAWFTRIAIPSFWQAALVLGVGIGLIDGLSYGLIDGLSYEPMDGTINGPMDGLIDGLHYGLIDGLHSGLDVSVMVVLVHVILASTIGSLRFAERIQWTWRGLLRRQHLRTSLIVAGALFLSYGLIDGLISALSDGISQGISLGLINGISVGLRIGLIDGLISGLTSGLGDGISQGISLGLTYWILLGLYQGIKQGHLEDQDRQQFNQGIRRSLRNGLLIGLISALIISTLIALRYALQSELGYALIYGESYALGSNPNAGLIDGLIDNLRQQLSHGLIDGLIVLFPGLLIIWTLSGGLTVLRHYIIRWLLDRHHTFPWRAQAFLDDATTRILMRHVGGGYSFIHRRLQDYFANAEVPPSEK